MKCPDCKQNFQESGTKYYVEADGVRKEICPICYVRTEQAIIKHRRVISDMIQDNMNLLTEEGCMEE